MATTKIYGRQIYSVNTGTAIGSGGANRVLYQDGSQNLASNTRFQFDGSHLSLIDATAATGGSPSVLSPYLNLNGRRWNGSADTASSMRISNTPIHIGSSNYIPSFNVDINAGSGWSNVFQVGAYPTAIGGGFGAYLKLRNPEVEAWGGSINVSYEGMWEFRDAAHAKSGVSPAYITWSANSAWKNLETFDGGYGTRINTYFGGDVVLHGNSNQLDTWFKYDDSNHVSLSVNSSGTATFNATGTTPRFDFSDVIRAQDMQIGNWATDNSYSVIGHATALGSSANNYAMLQNGSGATFINAASGQLLKLRINNGDVVSIAANDTTFTGAAHFGNGNGQSHLPYSDGDIYLSAPEIYFRDGSNVTHSYLSSTGLGIGMSSAPTAKLQVVSTTEQLRLSYDGSNLVKATVGSTGLATWDGAGSGVGFRFDQKVERKVNASTGYAKVGGLLFHHLTDSTTSGTGYTDLYTYSLAANTFSNNGDTVVAEYSGSFAGNTNSKLIFIRIAGVDVSDIDASAENGTEFNVKVTATKVSSSVLRVTTAWSYGTNSKAEYEEVTSLTFSNAYDIILRVRTSDQAGDITARFGVGYWYPGT